MTRMQDTARWSERPGRAIQLVSGIIGNFFYVVKQKDHEPCAGRARLGVIDAG